MWFRRHRQGANKDSVGNRTTSTIYGMLLSAGRDEMIGARRTSPSRNRAQHRSAVNRECGTSAHLRRLQAAQDEQYNNRHRTAVIQGIWDSSIAECKESTPASKSCSSDIFLTFPNASFF
uniref:CACTA en-spm transposon protein n=1 Tax=Ascaris lumbricoides TaxID=6252 RepID=A0A0M3IGU2_ASCLU